VILNIPRFPSFSLSLSLFFFFFLVSLLYPIIVCVGFTAMGVILTSAGRPTISSCSCFTQVAVTYTIPPSPFITALRLFFPHH
jgi:hypothetical protein